MSGNRVVVHKRIQSPSQIDQLGSTIPMAELFAAVPPIPPQPTRNLFGYQRRLVPVSMDAAACAGDLPEASVAGRSIQAVLFDLDTLFPGASSWHLQSLNRALKPFGVQIPSDNKLSCQLALESLTRDHRLPAFLHNMVRQIERIHANDEIHRRCWPRLEIESVLARLRQRGYRLAVCSAAARDRTSAMLERTGWNDRFEVVIHSEEVGHPLPDPETFLTACHRMALRPDQVLAVENSPRGQDSAKRAGVNVCSLGRSELADWIGVQRSIARVESSREGAFAC